jgi:hypothetical protein
VSPASRQICDYMSVHSLINSAANTQSVTMWRCSILLLHHTKAVVPVKDRLEHKINPGQELASTIKISGIRDRLFEVIDIFRL